MNGATVSKQVWFQYKIKPVPVIGVKLKTPIRFFRTVIGDGLADVGAIPTVSFGAALHDADDVTFVPALPLDGLSTLNDKVG